MVNHIYHSPFTIYHSPFTIQFMIARIALLFLLSISLSSLLAQDKVSFEASTDAKQLIENEYVQITFTLNNAQGTSFKAPNFTGFEVVNGPSRSNSMTIINGQRSQKMGYSYTLLPKKIGTFKIGAATINVKGKKLQTAPLTIKVLKAKAVPKGGAARQEVFVKVEADTTAVYLGQQVVINYKLYTTADIENYDIIKEADYPGFYSQDIRRFNARVLREVIDGVQYTTKVLKRIALFPQQSGLLEIEPMSLRLGVIVGKSRTNSFFYNNKIKPINVKTNALSIHVKNLPQPQPANFSGAVGTYNIAFNLSRNKITTDDVVSIILAIRGDGDIKRLQPPNLDLPADFELYDPKILEEQSQENGGLLSGYKKIEYLMLPKKPGRYRLSPAFTYFDTDSLKYVTLQPNVFNLSISQGSGTVANNVVNPVATQQKDIRFIKTATSFSTKGTPFPKIGLFYGLSLLPFLLLGGAFTYKRIQEKNSNIDISILKSRKAQKVAKQRLQVAEQHLTAKKSRAFYDEISKALLGYTSDKLKIPKSEMSKDNVREKLQSLKVSSQYVEDVMSIIKTTEMALFAGMDNKAAMQETYNKAVSVLSQIEEELS